MGNLQTALRHGLNQPFGLQPRNEFADGTECQPGQLDQMTLGNELPRAHVARQKVPGKALISLFPERRFFRLLVLALVHHRPVLRLSLL
ncbi:hypothetical protein D3C73_523180 [compost metagenome]